MDDGLSHRRDVRRITVYVERHESDDPVPWRHLQVLILGVGGDEIPVGRLYRRYLRDVRRQVRVSHDIVRLEIYQDVLGVARVEQRVRPYFSGRKVVSPVGGVLSELHKGILRVSRHHVRARAGDRVLVEVGVRRTGLAETSVVKDPLRIEHESIPRDHVPQEPDERSS